MGKEYAYARISRKTQKIERQIENLTRAYPNARIYQEAYTGTKTEGRREFNKMLSVVKPGDTIIFDSVSRMSRNADDGIKLYMDLYDRGINLVFLKEQYISTDVYKESIQQSIAATGNEIADIYIQATNKVIKLLAEQQIRKAFEQAEKEVQDLHERTREGIREAKRKGKQVGRVTGMTVTTKKSLEAKRLMREYSRDFDGTLNDIDTMTQIRARVGTLSRNSYYKYKKNCLSGWHSQRNADRH